MTTGGPDVSCFYEQYHEPGAKLADTASFSDPPISTELSQNYPNPFNAETLIRFSLDKPDYVELDVFNVLGQRASKVFSGFLPAGRHEYVWNGRDSQGNAVASGVYLYQMTGRDQGTVIQKKMVLLK